jgi:hypothetical protein
MNIKKNIKYFAAFFIPFSITAIYRPQVEVINKHWVNGSFTIEEPYLTILLILFLIIIPVGLIYAFQYIQLLKEELNDVEDDLQEFKDIKDELYVEGVLDELAMEMGEYDEDDEDDEY